MSWDVLVFWLLSFVTLGAALAVVFLKNIVHSALSLIVTFLGVAGLYISLQADFLAAVQVLIYAGAVSILIIFAIMLVSKGDGKMQETNLFGKHKYTAGIVSAGILGILSFFIINTPWEISRGVLPSDTVGSIAELLFTDYVLPFELAAILLLVAMIGAIVIAKEVKNS